MAQSDMLKRYLEAGIAFTEMTRARAEGIVKELVRTGEVQRDQVQSQVDDLIERSRRNTDQLITLIRNEVMAQLTQLGMATREELRALERRIRGGGSRRPASRRSATKKASAPRVAAKKAPAKRAATKKAATKRAATTTTAAKRTAAKRTAAKKAIPGRSSNRAS